MPEAAAPAESEERVKEAPSEMAPAATPEEVTAPVEAIEEPVAAAEPPVAETEAAPAEEAVAETAATPAAEAPEAAAMPEEPAPAEAAAAASAVAGPSGAPEAEKPPVILLIEDDERIAKFYTILFQAKGFTVENARDGLEGVDKAAELRPALILLDVMMPKMNGLMVLQTLRANPDTETTPVVVLSNYMEPPLIQRALQLGAIEYVVKSQARPEQLVNALPLWLEGKPALH
jgi:CheY-like chemotaxis protein